MLFTPVLAHGAGWWCLKRVLQTSLCPFRFLLSSRHRLKQIETDYRGLSHKRREMVHIFNEDTENTSNTYRSFVHHTLLLLSHFSVNCHNYLCVCVCVWCGEWVLLCVPDPAMVRCVSDDGCGGDLWGLHRLSTVRPQECHPRNPSSGWSAGTRWRAGTRWAVRGSPTAQRQPARWEPSVCY